MPRTAIDIGHGVESLSILNEFGALDEDLDPELPDDLLLKLHRAMLLGRRFDERMLRLQRQGRIGTFPPIKGQEAAHLGPIASLRPSDWLVPAFRETAGELWRGRTMENVLLFYAGYNQAGYVEPEINNLPLTIPVGTQIPHGVGIGYGMKYRGTDDVAMVFMGDGATSEGDFYEALNFAGVFQTPTIFVCQNNQWAISAPRSLQTRAGTLAQKAVAAGIPGIQVDGNDILATYAATREAVDRARAGAGPCLIECVTYRLEVHSTADDPKRYRSDEEVEAWAKRDPLPRFQTYLQDKELLTEHEVTALEEVVAAEIQQAVERAEARKAELDAEPMVIFDHLYAEMPSSLEKQRQAFADELTGNETDHG